VMADPSPSAQAVLAALCMDELNGPEQLMARAHAAAALRAAVAHTQEHHGHDVWECNADDLIAIAAELEGQ
jgi:hypothetical protein